MSHDNSEELVRMVNQIADFFQPYPTQDAEEGIELHIRDFWEPRMRRELGEILARDGAGLSPLARAGAARVFALPPPALAPAPGCDGG